MDKDEQIGGALYHEIVSSRRPYNAAELAGKVGVKEDKAREMLQKLCEICVICVRDDKYFPAEQVPQKDAETKPPSVEQCQTKKSMEEVQVEQATPPAGLPVSLVTDSGGAGQQIVRRKDSSMQCAVDQDRYKENEEIIQKIIDLLTRETGYMKSTTIAQKTGIGTGKSAVNRHLYFLVNKGVLSRDGTSFAMKKTITDEELKVLAAQLAKIPEGKKKTTSSSTDLHKDCPCPNRGPNCNHFHQHFQQNVTNIYVGNNVLMDSEHLERSDN